MEEWKKKRDSLLDPYDDQVMICIAPGQVFIKRHGKHFTGISGCSWTGSGYGLRWILL